MTTYTVLVDAEDRVLGEVHEGTARHTGYDVLDDVVDARRSHDDA